MTMTWRAASGRIVKTFDILQREAMPDPLPPSDTSQASTQTARQLRNENAKLRLLLEKHQWSGLTPAKSHGVCPECSGAVGHGHRPGCAIAAALAAPD